MHEAGSVTPSGTWADLANMLMGCFSPALVPFSRVAPFSALAMAGAFLGSGAVLGCLRMRGCVSTIMNALLVIASRDRIPTTRQGGRNGLQGKNTQSSFWSLKDEDSCRGPCLECRMPRAAKRAHCRGRWEQGTHCLANKPLPPSQRGKLGHRSHGCDRKPPIMGPAWMAVGFSQALLSQRCTTILLQCKVEHADQISSQD